MDKICKYFTTGYWIASQSFYNFSTLSIYEFIIDNFIRKYNTFPHVNVIEETLYFPFIYKYIYHINRAYCWFLFVVLMWKMEPAQVPADRHWTEEAHLRQLVWCYKICHNVASRSCTGPTRILKCHLSPCPGTRPLPAKGKNYIIFAHFMSVRTC